MTAHFPDTRELARLREDAEAFTMPDVCNLLTVTRTSDGQGGGVDTWGTARTDVPCLLTARSGVEKFAGGVVKDYHTYHLFLPYDTTITEAYRSEVMSVTYSVSSVDANKSLSGQVRCIVERVS